MLRIESPPSSKKLSATPTRSTPSTWAHTPARTRSVSVRGATNTVTSGRIPSGAGSAARSTFPPGVKGSAASSVNTAGTMNPGSRRPANSRNSATAGMPSDRSAGTRYATSRAGSWPARPPAAPSPSAVTTAALTAGWAASTASTSPGSTRNPRTFTWSSARPKNSSTPPAVHRTRSPDRYNRDPSPANQSATNRSPVSAARPAYPRATPAPPIHNSPATPTGTRPRYRSSTYTRVLATGPPIGGAPAPSGSTTPVHEITVVSVGPYPTTITQPRPPPAATPALPRSDPTTRPDTPAQPTGSATDNNDGATLA